MYGIQIFGFILPNLPHIVFVMKSSIIYGNYITERISQKEIAANTGTGKSTMKLVRLPLIAEYCSSDFSDWIWVQSFFFNDSIAVVFNFEMSFPDLFCTFGKMCHSLNLYLLPWSWVFSGVYIYWKSLHSSIITVDGVLDMEICEPIESLLLRVHVDPKSSRCIQVENACTLLVKSNALV